MENQASANTQAPERGQLTRMDIAPAFERVLIEQRSFLIDRIEDESARRGWDERQYRAYSRLVFLETGKHMPSYERFLNTQEQLHARQLTEDDIKRMYHDKKDDVEAGMVDTPPTEDDMAQDERENSEMSDAGTDANEIEFRDVEMADFARALASAEADIKEHRRGEDPAEK